MPLDPHLHAAVNCIVLAIVALLALLVWNAGTARSRTRHHKRRD